MNEVKWIKLTTDMFDNRKIKHLRRLPEGNSIVLIWVMLLTMAGRCNAGGMIFLTENIPYTPKMLADELGFEENTVRLALDALEKLEMITVEGASLSISGWEEHQNVEGLEKIREQTRLRVAKHREKQAQLAECNATCNATVTHGNATDIDKDKEEDKDKEKDNITSSDEDVRPTQVGQSDIKAIISAWNSLGLAQIRGIATNSTRRHQLCGRINESGVPAILEAIENIRKSQFLRGQNKNGWVITFDWLIKPSNFQKVLEGNYSDENKAQEYSRFGTQQYKDNLEDFI